MITDNFKREGRWDSVGLDCSSCRYFKSPSNWPDKNREIFCSFHKIPLSIELGEVGYKLGEWFCKEFNDNGKALANAVFEFNKIKKNLDENILYKFEKEGSTLSGIQIDSIKKAKGLGL